MMLPLGFRAWVFYSLISGAMRTYVDSDTLSYIAIFSEILTLCTMKVKGSTVMK